MALDYPSWVFCIREDVTAANMKKYDQMKKKWYETAEKLFPDYWKLGFKDRYALKAEIDAAVGYSL